MKNFTQQDLDSLRNELSVSARNGIDFITAAGIVWMIITFIWTLDMSTYNMSVLTFIAGGVMLPLAFVLSRIYGTTWKIKDNPLQPLGLWLNFAQLFYFPFLVFVLIKMPDYFVMVYVIITGGHFFPYAWFYNTRWYAIVAGITVVGALVLGLTLESSQFFYIPLFMTASLLTLAFLLHADSSAKKARTGMKIQFQA
jgi:hypothetical protein